MRLFTSILASASLAFAACAAHAADPLSEAAALAGEFERELRGKLIAAMAQGGPSHAVMVCKVEAPAIAARLSAESGWTMKRVGTRVRNVATGGPDAWEQAQLDRFAAVIASGESPTSLRRLEVVQTQEGPVQRYAQAILTAAPCLACHGDPAAQAEVLKDTLRTHYPQDAATGYRENELRGAFSLQRPLP